MSTSMASFLIELLHTEANAIEAIEKRLFEEQLTPEQRTGLVDLHTRFEDLCESLRKVIREQEL
jgi:hypothetical protein